MLGELADRELDIAFSCDSAVIDSFPHECGFNDSIILAVNEKCAVNKQLAENALTAEDIKKGFFVKFWGIQDFNIIALDNT